MVYAGVGLSGALLCVSGVGGFSVGNLTSFLNYANQYTKPFNEISGVITELQNAMACAGRVFELIEAPARTPEPEHPEHPEKVEGSMEIRDLKFSYTPEKPLIDDFDLSVKPGMKIAIVGPTGCGKTTFINLLMRFYDPQDFLGKILSKCWIPVADILSGIVQSISQVLGTTLFHMCISTIQLSRLICRW